MTTALTDGIDLLNGFADNAKVTDAERRKMHMVAPFAEGHIVFESIIPIARYMENRAFEGLEYFEYLAGSPASNVSGHDQRIVIIAFRCSELPDRIGVVMDARASQNASHCCSHYLRRTNKKPPYQSRLNRGLELPQLVRPRL